MARILVVDDEHDVVTLIKFLLEKDGHEVAAAFNGQEALKVLGVEPEGEGFMPDLIILDVMMPIVDGFTVARKLGQSPKHRAVPIVVLTAKGHVKDLFDMADNVATFLDKPFDPKKLRDLIEGILGK